MFDGVQDPGGRGVSSAERGLTAVLERSSSPSCPCVVDGAYPSLRWGLCWEVEIATAGATEMDRLLAAGARPLARAAAASREIAKLSAVVATSLAEFARCRPAALFDRQPGEQGRWRRPPERPGRWC